LYEDIPQLAGATVSMGLNVERDASLLALAVVVVGVVIALLSSRGSVA